MRSKLPTRSKGLFKFRKPSAFFWLLVSAVLFLLGAAVFSSDGAKQLAEVGVFGAVAAIALIVAFLY